MKKHLFLFTFIFILSTVPVKSATDLESGFSLAPYKLSRTLIDKLSLLGDQQKRFLKKGTFIKKLEESDCPEIFKLIEKICPTMTGASLTIYMLHDSSCKTPRGLLEASLQRKIFGDPVTELTTVMATGPLEITIDLAALKKNSSSQFPLFKSDAGFIIVLNKALNDTLVSTRYSVESTTLSSELAAKSLVQLKGDFKTTSSYLSSVQTTMLFYIVALHVYFSYFKPTAPALTAFMSLALLLLIAHAKSIWHASHKMLLLPGLIRSKNIRSDDRLIEILPNPDKAMVIAAIATGERSSLRGMYYLDAAQRADRLSFETEMVSRLGPLESPTARGIP